MARDSVGLRFASYLGGVPGQERRNSGEGTLHFGPKTLYVSKGVVLGVAVFGVKFGKVDVGKVSWIEIEGETVQDRVAVIVHMNDGSTGIYELRGEPMGTVLGRLQPIANQLGIRIAERVLHEVQVTENA